VRSMVELAHAFDLKVVAEWVDTAEDAEILASHGVNFLQGNMLGEASIIAPWKGAHGAAFELDSNNIAPVDSVHFQNVMPDIATPHDVETVTEHFIASAPADVAREPLVEPELRAADAGLLDDAALDAEIALLDPETPQVNDVEVSLEPLYETALNNAPLEEEAAPVSEADDADVDDHLDQLRAALAALNAAFGESKSEGDGQRMAS
jgi:EAL domain-containing protein (putative c-di-GMP-specific phosphodiesterase class I)